MDTLMPLFALLPLVIFAPGLASVRFTSRAPWLVSRFPVSRLSVFAAVTVLPVVAWLAGGAGHGDVAAFVSLCCAVLLWVWVGELFTGRAAR
jgi:hypothetical protein